MGLIKEHASTFVSMFACTTYIYQVRGKLFSQNDPVGKHGAPDNNLEKASLILALLSTFTIIHFLFAHLYPKIPFRVLKVHVVSFDVY
jgi:hypothetical protein